MFWVAQTVQIDKVGLLLYRNKTHRHDALIAMDHFKLVTPKICWEKMTQLKFRIWLNELFFIPNLQFC